MYSDEELGVTIVKKNSMNSAGGKNWYGQNRQMAFSSRKIVVGSRVWKSGRKSPGKRAEDLVKVYES